MALFTNYKIKQGDTLQSISQQMLGDVTLWSDIASLNQLRFPYISDDIYETLGLPKATFQLSQSLYKGSTSINVYNQINNGTLIESLLQKNDIIFLKSYDGFGNYVSDTLTIEKYYSIATNVDETGSGSFTTYDAGTVIVGTEYITPPLISAKDAGFVSSVAGGSLSERKYFVRYSYITTLGQTTASPNNTSANGKPEAYTVEANKRLTFTAPQSWPTNVVGIDIYVGTVAGQEYCQERLSSLSQTYTESTGGILTGTITPVLSNTAREGVLHFYPAGTFASIHRNPDENKTRVLKLGDTIRLPISSGTQNGLIANYVLNSNNKNNEWIDSLGKDILVNQYGVLQFNTQGAVDFSTVSGVDNLKQTIQARLITRMGYMMTQPAFGNMALSQIGSKYTPSFINRLRGLIIQTILSEERVSSILNVNITYNPQTSVAMVQDLSIKISASGSVVNINPITLSF